MAVGPDDIDDFFDDNGLQLDLDDIANELRRSYEIGALREGVVMSQAQLKAVEYAKSHAGELVKGIDDTTRAWLKSEVTRTIDQGLSLGDLRKRIQEGDVFGRKRAEVIARTETAIAHGRGARDAASLMNQDQKSWVRNQSEPEDECTENEDAGWIGIDDVFPSGDDTVPAHPNCECDVIYRTSDLYTDEDLDESEDDSED